MAQAPEIHTVTLLGPSFIMFGDEKDNRQAVAEFTIFSTDPPVVESVPLSKTIFAKVGGAQIGGPTLTQINVSNLPSELIIPLRPETSFSGGPYAWAILQPPVLESEQPLAYTLQIFANGKTEIVKFTNAIPDASKDLSSPIHEMNLDNGAIYNDLNEGLLNVTYNLLGGGSKDTPIVGRGDDTGGVFSGFVTRFNIRDIAGQPVYWQPNEDITTSKGLPVVVYGSAAAPLLAVFQESGPPKTVPLVHYHS